MDFWEGELIGPFWIHTDYSDKRHSNFHLLVGLCAMLFALAVLFFPSISGFFPFPAWFYLVLALALIMLLPFVAARYNTFVLPVKLLVLIAYGIQYIAAWLFPVKLLASYTQSNSAGLLPKLANLGDEAMNQIAQFFSFLGGLAASLAGVVMGAILTTLVVFFALLLVVTIPLIYLYIVKRLQRLVDYLVMTNFYPQRYRF